MNFSDITLVSITGSEDYTLGSMYALQRSYMELGEQPQAILVSPNRPDNLPDYIQHIYCKPFSYLEYNLYILYALKDIIKTEFCISVQDDGWIINGKNWQDKFFQYDFIGAVVPALVNYEPHQITTGHWEYWCDNHKNPPAGFQQLLNGGFSLRSKRLLELPSQLNIPLTIHSPLTAIENNTLSIHWDLNIHNEDVFLTGVNRVRLEQAGIKFADIYTATAFSIESILLSSILNVPLERIFGVHLFGLFKLTGLNEVTITSKLKSRSTDYLQSPTIEMIIQLFKQYGYLVRDENQGNIFI
ncbi:DUF5672 family protein [Lonepinella sp. BR2357]|uniref:DUF5672 family protein n=1 Tax=Lonepinella sp. BR2357 TaxID=3434549 RepID=UPI003F6E39D5